MLCQPIRKALANLSRIQFNDAIMLFTQLHFTFRAHHTKALDTADFTNTNGDINTWNIHTRLSDHYSDTCTRIGGTTNDLGNASSSLHLTDTQLICVRVLFSFYNFANAKY